MNLRTHGLLRALGAAALLSGGASWMVSRSIHQARLNEDLIGKISDGDTPAVLRLLVDGADPNAGVTLDDRNLITRLIDRLHPSEGIVPYTTYTPLTTAATFHRLDIAQILLAHGIDIDKTDERGRTALSIAAESNSNPEAVLNAKVIVLLLNHGADINLADRDGYTPLMYAVMGGQPGNVRLLLARGADLKRRNDNGQTAFALATSSRPWWQHEREIAAAFTNASVRN